MCTELRTRCKRHRQPGPPGMRAVRSDRVAPRLSTRIFCLVLSSSAHSASRSVSAPSFAHGRVEHDVRPVGTEDQPLRRRLHERACERRHVRVGKQHVRRAIRRGEFGPRVAGLQRANKGLKARCADAESRIGTAHVIDHDLGRKSAARRPIESRKSSIRQELHVPSERLYALGQCARGFELYADLRYEASRESPRAGGIEALQLCVAHVGCNECETPPAGPRSGRWRRR